MNRKIQPLFFYSSLIVFSSCAPNPTPVPGPDKQGAGFASGAAMGAGSGAIIGAQVTAGAGPGAVVGAGMGAVFGAIHGFATDLLEDEELKQIKELEKLKCQAWVQEVLAEHYDKRLSLYPGREIFPADVFFEMDRSKMSTRSKLLAREIGKRTKAEMPWSRVLITSYSTASEPDSDYATHLNESRAEAIALQFVKAGVEPRRISTRSVTMTGPLVLDPNDSPGRYRTAIEFIPLDY